MLFLPVIVQHTTVAMEIISSLIQLMIPLLLCTVVRPVELLLINLSGEFLGTMPFFVDSTSIAKLSLIKVALTHVLLAIGAHSPLLLGRV